MVCLKLALGLSSLLCDVADMCRESNSSGRVSDGALDSLTNPPTSIGSKTEALCMIKLFSTPDKTNGAFLNEIGETDTMIGIFLRNANDESEISADQTVLVHPCNSQLGGKFYRIHAQLAGPLLIGDGANGCKSGLVGAITGGNNGFLVELLVTLVLTLLIKVLLDGFPAKQVTDVTCAFGNFMALEKVDGANLLEIGDETAISHIGVDVDPRDGLGRGLR